MAMARRRRLDHRTSLHAARTVLVTGGCGFIGHNLVEELLAAGAQVTVLDLPAAELAQLPPGVTQVKADLLDAGIADRRV